jgi:hypothetical protein
MLGLTMYRIYTILFNFLIILKLWHYTLLTFNVISALDGTEQTKTI